jgi:hypothetical protein
MLNDVLRLLVNDLVYWKFLPSPVLEFLASDLVLGGRNGGTGRRRRTANGATHNSVSLATTRCRDVCREHRPIYRGPRASLFAPASRNEPGVVYQPGSAASNSFPSHHALLAALVVSWVVFARPRRAIPFWALR